MGLGSIITMAVIGANIILVVLFFISQSAGARADPEIAGDGRKVIRPSKSLLWVGILAGIWALLGVYLAIDALMSERNAASALLMALILVVSMAPFSLWMILRYLRYRIRWDDRTMEVTGVSGKTRSLEWNDLREIAQRNEKTTVREPIYPGIVPARIFDLELRFEDGKIVRAAPNLAGYHGFVRDAAMHRDRKAETGS